MTESTIKPPSADDLADMIASLIGSGCHGEHAVDLLRRLLCRFAAEIKRSAIEP